MQLGRFLAPIAFTNIAKDIGQQVLNRSLSNGSQAITTLAGFGLAYTLMKLFTNSLAEFKHVGIVLVSDQAARCRALVILVLCGIATALIMSLLGTTKLGVWFVEDLHGVNRATGVSAYYSFVALSCYPILDSVASLHAGCLLRQKRSGMVGMASMSDMGLQIIMVTALLHTGLLCSKPLVIPILALYTGMAARLAVLIFSYYRFIHATLAPAADVESATYRRILTFFWPLALVKVMQSVSRPIVNLLAARSSRHLGKAAVDRTVAVLSLTFPIGHLPYGWINETRALTPTFRRQKAGVEPMKTRSISLFMVLCLAISLSLMVILFWIPGVSVAMLIGVNGVTRDLADASVVPLRIFSFFGIAVSLRSHFTGWLMLREHTKYIAPSAPTRVLVIVAMLFILPAVGVTGATMGVASLLTGFLVEAILVVLAALWVRRKLRRQYRKQGTAGQMGSSDEVELVAYPDSQCLLEDPRADDKDATPAEGEALANCHSSITEV